MSHRVRLAPVFVLLALALSPAPAATQTSTAEAFIVHGIPGQDVGLDAALPVDISVNGACALTNLRFGQIVGPIHLPAATLALAIHPASASSPCGLAPVVGPANVPFLAGEKSTVIAHLTSAGAPTASKFVNNLSKTSANRARVTVHHAANAPAVDAYVSREFGTPLATLGLVSGLVNGEQATLPVGAGAWQLALTAAGSTAAAFGPGVIRLSADKAYFLYVVGSLTNRTLTVIAKDVSELQ